MATRTSTSADLFGLTSGQPDMRGRLKKKGKRLGSKVQWFEVRGGSLLCYKQEQAARPKRVINLRGARVAVSDDRTFTLSGPFFPREYVLKAATPQEREQWCAAIRAALALSSSGSAPNLGTPSSVSASAASVAAGAGGRQRSGTLGSRAPPPTLRAETDVPMRRTLSDGALKLKRSVNISAVPQVAVRQFNVNSPPGNLCSEDGGGGGLDRQNSGTLEGSMSVSMMKRGSRMTGSPMVTCVDGWETFTRTVDIGFLSRIESLLKAVAQVFPELPCNGLALRPKMDVFNPAQQQLIELDSDVSTLSWLTSSHVLVILPDKPLCLRDLRVDYDEDLYRNVELRYFAPTYDKLVTEVQQAYPVSMRYLSAITYKDVATGQDVEITQGTDWTQLVASCDSVTVQTGFQPENKYALTLAWSRKVGTTVPPTPLTAWAGTADPKALEALRDRVLGLVYGAVVGDLWGLRTEGMTSEKVRSVYTDVALDARPQYMDQHRQQWKDGDWSDDTDTLLVVMDSLMRNGGRVDPKDIACGMYHWLNNGYNELGDVRGVGVNDMDRATFLHPAFLTDPHFAAQCVHLDNSDFASNMALLRGMLVGVLRFRDDQPTLERDTNTVVRCTHNEPKCVAAAVAFNTAVAMLLRGATATATAAATAATPEAITEAALQAAQRHVSDADALAEHLRAEELIELDIDDHYAMADVYKALGCAFFALRSGGGFEATVKAVVSEGGDADGNAAAAGALLGCRLGFNAIRDTVAKARLLHSAWLERRLAAFLRFLGLP